MPFFPLRANEDLSSIRSRPGGETILPRMHVREEAVASRAPISPRSPAELLVANLRDLLCQRDVRLQKQGFDTIWCADATIFETDGSTSGREAVLAMAARFAARMSGATIELLGPVVGCDDIYMLRWSAQFADKAVVTGSQTACLRDGKIESMYLVDD